MRAASLLALLAAVGLLAACGGAQQDSAADFQGEQRRVAQAVEALEEAAQDESPRRICRQLLARAVVRRLADTGQSCEATIDRALDEADSFALDVETVRISGNTARVRVQSAGDEDEIDTLALVREDNRWKIASLGG